MKRSKYTTAILSLISAISASTWSNFGFAGTHAVHVQKPGIVKLFSISAGGQCTGAIVGVRPLTVLTAFHCISHIENGDVMVGIENERQLIKKNPLNYVSTKAVLSPAFKSYPEYTVLKEVNREIVTVAKSIVRLKADLESDKENKTLAIALREQTALAKQMNEFYQYAMNTLLTRSMNDDAASDLAILVFERYEGPLNLKSSQELLASGEVLPIAPNERLAGTTVSFAGFGMTGEPNQTRASKNMGAFQNTVRVQKGNTLATFGMMPGKTSPLMPKGLNGAILQGDSGGPLMNDYGIVGVASYIKRDPMETDREPAPGWPQDRDGFYSYMTGRFVDLSSDRARDLIAYANTDHNLNIEENQLMNLALTDLSSWEIPGSPKTSPLPTPNPGTVLAQASKP